LLLLLLRSYIERDNIWRAIIRRCSVTIPIVSTEMYLTILKGEDWRNIAAVDHQLVLLPLLFHQLLEEEIALVLLLLVLLLLRFCNVDRIQ
jgi:hypothetical protein